jgi:inorganic pyrophosphatase
MHPWHDVSTGDNAPQLVNGIIEIPQGTKAKYEVDKKTGLLRLDRVLYSAVFYPCNYGFIPQTLCGDGDPLDILVISSVSMERLSLVEAKVIGVMRMTDEGAPDDKIIAVPKSDIYVAHIDSIEDLPPHTLPEIKRFFEDYQILEGQKVTVDGFFGKEKAYEILLANITAYQDKFLNLS